MERIATIGDNNPPEDERIEALSPADEIEAIVKEDTLPLQAKAKAILDTVSRIPDTITNDDIYGRVVTVAARLREVSSEIDECRKKHKQPYLDAGKKIDDLFKLGAGKDALSKRLETSLTDLSARLAERDTAVLGEERARIAEERSALAAALAADGLEMNGEAPDIDLGTFASPTGGLATRTVERRWDVSDPSKLPTSVLSLDPKKVEKLLKSGVSEIPGMTITDHVVTVVKRR